jgi:hypothetical protein
MVGVAHRSRPLPRPVPLTLSRPVRRARVNSPSGPRLLLGRARRFYRHVAEYLARAPGTHVLLLVLAVTTLVLRGLDAPTATRILRHHSTNLLQMSRDAPRVLLLSTFLLDRGRPGPALLLDILVLVMAERWIGTYRWLGVFVAGHVGATLATTIGIWLQVRSGAAGRALVYPVDVGVSYGVYAVAAVLTFRFPRPASWVWAMVLTAIVGRAVLRTGTFTDWGHLAAFGIGLALGPLVQPHSAAAPPRPAPPLRVLAPAWRWLGTRPPPRPSGRRRAVLLLGAGLLTAAAGLLVVIGSFPDKSIVVPPRGLPVQAAVLGHPPGCPADCRTVVVRYRPGGEDLYGVLLLPPGTLTNPGDRLSALVDPARPGRLHLFRPARRVRPDGLFGAMSVATGGTGIALLAASRRARA